MNKSPKSPLLLCFICFYLFIYYFGVKKYEGRVEINSVSALCPQKTSTTGKIGSWYPQFRYNIDGRNTWMRKHRIF